MAINVERLKTVCSSCSLRELCMPVGLSQTDLDKVDGLVQLRRSSKRGDHVFRAGESFHALYAVRAGFFKTTLLTEDGRDQVTGFQMAGELLGMDGIGTGKHACDAVALEDSELCVIPFPKLEEISLELPALQQHMHRVMSREIVRDHGVMMLLGSMRAEERLAAFLVNLSQRYSARGFSANEFILRMTREEIGSYLGLKLETVSRLFSKLQEEGVISVNQKRVTITAVERLRSLVNQRPC
jgi:CRP/FNR family transcriptional regulator